MMKLFTFILGLSLFLSVHPQTVFIDDIDQPSESSFKWEFKNPIMAYYVLSSLDQFEPVDDKYNTANPIPGNSFDKFYLGLKQDDEYCDKVRRYWITHPELIYQRNLLSTFSNTLPHKLKFTPMAGIDMHPDLSYNMASNLFNSRSYEISPAVNHIYTGSGSHYHLHLGKHIGCLTQEYSYLPGHWTLNRKDQISISFKNYIKENYKNRPQCFSEGKYIPVTWHLDERDQCLDFFNNHFNTPEYFELKEKYHVLFIRKQGAGAHLGKGVEAVHAKEEASLRDIFRNGTLCGTVKKNYLMQRYLNNSLLVKGRKIDFRIYLLVASANPLMAFYHDGFMRVSIHKYDPTSTESNVFMTITSSSLNVYKDVIHGKDVNGIDMDEVRDNYWWDLYRLQDYLIEIGKINNTRWVDEYLRPEFKKVLVHVLRATQYGFLKRSQVYELFGTDFMLDEDLNIWFLEANTHPTLDGEGERQQFIKSMVLDHFDIVFSLLKSRMKRIITFVNAITANDECSSDSRRTDTLDIATLKAEFKQLSMNRFEPEFSPHPNNKFQIIIDENLNVPDRYFNLIPPECL